MAKRTVVAATKDAFERNIQEMGLPTILADRGRTFRAKVLEEVIDEMGVSVASAASAYNTTRTDYEGRNIIPAGSLGRKPKQAAKTTDSS